MHENQKKKRKKIPSMGNFSAMKDIMFWRKDEQSIWTVVSIKYKPNY